LLLGTALDKVAYAATDMVFVTKELIFMKLDAIGFAGLPDGRQAGHPLGEEPAKPAVKVKKA
jgi:hypothetical protein